MILETRELWVAKIEYSTDRFLPYSPYEVDETVIGRVIGWTESDSTDVWHPVVFEEEDFAARRWRNETSKAPDDDHYYGRVQIFTELSKAEQWLDTYGQELKKRIEETRQLAQSIPREMEALLEKYPDLSDSKDRAEKIIEHLNKRYPLGQEASAPLLTHS